MTGVVSLEWWLWLPKGRRGAVTGVASLEWWLQLLESLLCSDGGAHDPLSPSTVTPSLQGGVVNPELLEPVSFRVMTADGAKWAASAAAVFSL